MTSHSRVGVFWPSNCKNTFIGKLSDWSTRTCLNSRHTLDSNEFSRIWSLNMKHNFCLTTIPFFVRSSSIFVLLLLLNQSLFAKVVTSEFFNQAAYGSDGPLLTEIEVGTKHIYLLKYLRQGGRDLLKAISKSEFQKIQSEMISFFDINENKNEDSVCERELTYTKVEKEDQVSNRVLCWHALNAEKRMKVSQWIMSLQKNMEVSATFDSVAQINPRHSKK